MARHLTSRLQAQQLAGPPSTWRPQGSVKSRVDTCQRLGPPSLADLIVRVRDVPVDSCQLLDPHPAGQVLTLPLGDVSHVAGIEDRGGPEVPSDQIDRLGLGGGVGDSASSSC